VTSEEDHYMPQPQSNKPSTDAWHASTTCNNSEQWPVLWHHCNCRCTRQVHVS